MTYCENKSSATVLYKFKEKEEKRFVVEEENLPVDVAIEKIKKDTGLISEYSFSFDGEVEGGSYTFTVEAPEEIPSELEDIQIFLERGIWDDYGGIGNYSTGYGVVKSFKGDDPILIGTGRSVDGTVVNLHPIECYANGAINWRFENAVCRLIISYQGEILHEEEGECPLEFEVVCDKDCPKEYLKCKSNKYPGYCCLPCKKTANKIRALGAKLK